VTWLNEVEESSSFYDIKLESPLPQSSSGSGRGRDSSRAGTGAGGDRRVPAGSPQQTVFIEVWGESVTHCHSHWHSHRHLAEVRVLISMGNTILWLVGRRTHVLVFLYEFSLNSRLWVFT